MLGFAVAICFAKKSEIVIGNTALIGSALSGFAAFSVIKIQRHVFAGIPIQSTIIALAAVEKKFVVIHNYNSLFVLIITVTRI